MNQRRLKNLEPRQYLVEPAVPRVTATEAAAVRIMSARQSVSLGEMHMFFAMLGVAE